MDTVESPCVVGRGSPLYPLPPQGQQLVVVTPPGLTELGDMGQKDGPPQVGKRGGLWGLMGSQLQRGYGGVEGGSGSPAGVVSGMEGLGTGNL